MEYTMAEIDFVLEMASIDDPERYVFLRGGKDPKRVALDVAAAWVATAHTTSDRLARAGLLEAQARLKAHKQKIGSGAGLKPGITRKGKPIGNA
jgi:hypothetical protein